MSEETSAAEPIVILGDPLTRGGEWSRVRPLLAPAMGLIDIELPAGGRSVGLDPARIEEVLAGEIEGRDQFPAHLLASAFAAGPAIRLAVARPELVRSLLLHDPLAVLHERETPASATEVEIRHLFSTTTATLGSGNPTRAAAALTEFWGGDETDEATLAGVLGGNGSAATQWLTQPPAMAPWEVRLTPGEEFQAPTLVVTGDLSPALVHRIARQVATRLPNVTEIRLPGATHFDPWRNPARLAGLVLAFCLERNVPVT